MRMAITPERVSLTEVRSVCELPIDALQLRRKEMATKPFYFFAKECRAITKEKGILLLINDRLDVALSVEADGVHLPQESLPCALVRQMCPDFLIGVSTHTNEEVIKAYAEGASYLTFSNSVKGKRPNIVLLRELAQKVRIPILALGNLQKECIEPYLQAGAKGYAAIRMFFG